MFCISKDSYRVLCQHEAWSFARAARTYVFTYSERKKTFMDPSFLNKNNIYIYIFPHSFQNFRLTAHILNHNTSAARQHSCHLVPDLGSGGLGLAICDGNFRMPQSNIQRISLNEYEIMVIIS